MKEELKKMFEKSMLKGWGMWKEEIYFVPRCFLGFHWNQKKTKNLYWLAWNWETLEKGINEHYYLTTEKGKIVFDMLWDFIHSK